MKSMDPTPEFRLAGPENFATKLDVYVKLCKNVHVTMLPWSSLNALLHDT